ncbi:RNA polymerase sigma-D factor [Actinokineospora sp. UTMC 2448]|nr:RNA polymerase sigma-D factor [Actinokineospora sp. UTMC 2448]
MGMPRPRLPIMRKPRLSSSRRPAIPGPRPTSEVRTAIAALPPVQREVLRLRLLEGLSADEVAERLSMTPAAVRLVQHRALTALRVYLASRN